MIDCDVHCAPAAIAELEPFLSEYWRQYIQSAGVSLSGLPRAYPSGAPSSASAEAREGPGPAVPARYDVLRERLLERTRPRYAILNCLTSWEAYRNPYYQAAITSATNDWIAAEWLDRDERLRASIAVPTADPDAAVAEIERLGDDARFVQVLLPIRTDAPYGNKRYHRIYAAAAERDLVIGLHAWGALGQAPIPSGFTRSYVEDYLSNPIIVQWHILSLVSEGVFDRFPSLRVSLLECGFTWLPPLLWRFDKDWKGLWLEVPWVKEKPSSYVHRHFRATTAPALLPADNQHVVELLDAIGVEWLMHASDYPHDHGRSGERLHHAVGSDDAEAILDRNAAELYRLAA